MKTKLKKRITGHERAIARVRRGESRIKHLSKMGLFYFYGGGRLAGRIIEAVRGTKWTDCSGCATDVCDVMGIKLKNDAGSTWSLAEEGESGTSEYFTLFIKNASGDEHVIMRFRKRPRPWHFGRPRYRWGQCGGTDNPDSRGGPSFFIPGLKMGMNWKDRVAEFPIHRQFDKQLEA